MGKKEIVINAEKEQTRIAIVENGELAELYFETPENERTLGDIYLGRVRRVMPSIQAAFIDIGQKQDAFLHFSDLSENLGDWLDLVDQDQPRVKVFKPKNIRHVSRRHRPRHGRPKGGGKDNGDNTSGESPRHRKPDAKTRGQRRSAQRRSRGKRTEEKKNNEQQTVSTAEVRPETLLQRDQRLLVKVVKEPISNKGSRVSADISLAGRFLVLVPLADYAAVSKRIGDPKERRRLRVLAKSLLPEGFGVIVRTVARGKDAKTLDTDLRLLLEKWYKIEKNLAGKPDGPIKVHEDVNMASSIIRDLFTNDYDRILIDHPRMYRNVRNYIHAIAPQMEKAVQAHKGNNSIFEATGLKKAIEEVFESRVNLPTGGYLFIERTEAMHVVDVNSGRSGRGMSQEQNSVKVNLEAARVIAKQVRLRDLGGIIVVDFIDLREERNRKKIYDELKKEFRSDRAVTKILPMSDFGLIQITRQRLRPSITTTYSSPNAKAEGGDGASSEKPDKPEPAKEERPPRQKKEKKERGNRRPRPYKSRLTPTELVQHMEKWITRYKKHGYRGGVTLKVHPFTAAFLQRRMPNHPTRWFLKHFVRVYIEPDETISPMMYRFFDPRSGEDLTDTVRNGKV